MQFLKGITFVSLKAGLCAKPLKGEDLNVEDNQFLESLKKHPCSFFYFHFLLAHTFKLKIKILQGVILSRQSLQQTLRFLPERKKLFLFLLMYLLHS